MIKIIQMIQIKMHHILHRNTEIIQKFHKANIIL